MPGFTICGTGTDAAAAVDGKVEARRRYRWVLQITNLGNRAWAYLKSANRPKLTLGTIEQHHNQEKIWHEGKTSWNDLTCTFYDIEAQPDVSREVYNWLQTTTYDINGANARHPSTYKQDALLDMKNFSGTTTESWKLCNAWPFDVDWGNVDYSSEELCEVVAVIKYDRAQKTA